MRRVILIVSAVIAVLVVVAGAIVLYAVTNLNSIIAERRQTILDKVSSSLGREVHADDIKASVGWGVMADLKGVRVGDDAAISQQPFLEASDVYAKLQVMPLLARRVEVTEVVLDKPVIRIIQTRDGRLNVSTIGKKKNVEELQNEVAKQKAEHAGGGSAFGSLYVKDLSVNQGTLIFQQEGASPATINSIDLKVRNFDFTSAFDVTLVFAALSDRQNVDLVATVGPVMKNGAIDVNAIPISAKIKGGPIDLARLKTIPIVAKSIPPNLTVEDPVNFDAQADGTLTALKFNAQSDLSGNRIRFGDSFDKPAGVALKISAQGTRTGSTVEVSHADLTLGEVNLKAGNIRVGGGQTSARIDSNSFDLAPIGKIVPALGKYGLTGKSEIHSDVAFANGKPSANGTISLADVGMNQPDQKTPPVSHVTGVIKMNGSSADVGPIAFNLGGSQATIKSHVAQFQPLSASYDLSAAAVHLADLAPARPAEEQINNLSATGNVAINPNGPKVDSKVLSASGNVAGVVYQNLDLALTLEGKRARVLSLKMGAFTGNISATAETSLEPHSPFTGSINFSNLNIQQALESQKSKAAGIIRGSLSGNANIAATMGTFDEMKPTMKGNGKLSVVDAKLIGINIGGSALSKVQNLPGIGSLVPDNVIARHPELFSNPDTDIKTAGLTYVLEGPRITSHDIRAETVDYILRGDGWFDMDKNIDLAANITLSPQFSKELIEQKKQVAYIANRDGQIDIPLQITGQLPKPSVLPNVTELAQRAGTHAVQEQGQKYIGKFLGKKGLPGGLGSLLGGGSGDGSNGSGSSGGDSSGSGGGSDGGGGGSGGSKPPPNPLDQLKKLF
ncbi:MAG: hypothetical protein JWM69_335 [Candidatus Binatus sp.]|nr:hypothetical protein [Candidatus Binatus sp.]